MRRSIVVTDDSLIAQREMGLGTRKTFPYVQRACHRCLQQVYFAEDSTGVGSERYFRVAVRVPVGR